MSRQVLNNNETSGTITNVAGDYIVHGVGVDQILGTRAALLSALETWANSVDAQNVFWLKGVAGSGKSTIAHTIACIMHETGRLVSSFFLNHQIPARKIFTTIARDIAATSLAIAYDICSVLKNEPALASASLSRQFKALISGPLGRHPFDRTIVIVIDALDEAIHGDGDTALLAILGVEAANLPPHVRIFITSRPTNIIEQFLWGKSYIRTHLIDIHSIENLQDISAYVDAQLQNHTIRRKMRPTELDEALVQDLKARAEGLFIWISTIFAYLRTAYNPRATLATLLSKSMPQGLEPTKKMDELYISILETCGPWKDVYFVKDYSLIMGAIMAAKRPLSLAALQAFHGGHHQPSAAMLLECFGSVLVGFEDENKPVRMLHLSFREFITDRAASDTTPLTHKFYIPLKAHNGRLTRLCLQTMINEFKSTTHVTRYLADDYDGPPGIPSKDAHISEHFLYACECWIDHVVDVEQPSLVGDLIFEFLSHHHTAWLEALTRNGVFRGSLRVRAWLNEHASEFRALYRDEIQASLLRRLSGCLAYELRNQEGLVAILESADLYRSLAAKNPGQFNPKLLSCLCDVSMYLGGFQQRQALTRVREAVLLGRALVEERPTASSDDLARSLQHLYRCLRVREPSKAFGAMKEAVAIRTVLAEDNPSVKTKSLLAESLINLANCLWNVDQEECMMAYTTSTALCREIMLMQVTEQASQIHIPNRSSLLALSLSNMATRLSALGRWEDALAASQESVHLLRTISGNGQPRVYQMRLAALLQQFSTSLRHSQRPEDALAAIQEAVGIYRILGAEQRAVPHITFGDSLYSLADCLNHLDRTEEAAKAIYEASQAYRAVAPKRRPASWPHMFIKVAHQLSAQKRYEEGLAFCLEAVEECRDLARKQPASLQLKCNVASALCELSGHYRSVDQTERALAVVLEAAEIFIELSKSWTAGRFEVEDGLWSRLRFNLTCLVTEPVSESIEVDEDPGAQLISRKSKVARTLNDLSIRSASCSVLREALNLVEDSVSLYKTLAEEGPMFYNDRLANALLGQSNFLADLGQPDDALAAIEQSVELRRALTAEQPLLYGLRLVRSLINMSNRLWDLHRQEEGLAVLGEAIDRCRALTAEESGEGEIILSEAGSFLADCLRNFGIRVSELGQQDEALMAAREPIPVARYQPLAADHGRFALGLRSGRIEGESSFPES
ncbi:hypothetical protein HWV62_40830 [Athelia sp. TMB]|nr:hypothetical protein HWV62_40830 [Athelia sp. TMB]